MECRNEICLVFNFFSYNQYNKKAAVIENKLKRERSPSVASEYLLNNYYDFFIEINYFMFKIEKEKNLQTLVYLKKQKEIVDVLNC